MPPKVEIPEWVTRGKTIRQLIKELQTFENQDMEVRMSLDDGETHHLISLVVKSEDKYCVLLNAEEYYNTRWQDFVAEQDAQAENSNSAES